MIHKQINVYVVYTTKKRVNTKPLKLFLVKRKVEWK